MEDMSLGKKKKSHLVDFFPLHLEWEFVHKPKEFLNLWIKFDGRFYDIYKIKQWYREGVVITQLFIFIYNNVIIMFIPALNNTSDSPQKQQTGCSWSCIIFLFIQTWGKCRVWGLQWNYAQQHPQSVGYYRGNLFSQVSQELLLFQAFCCNVKEFCGWGFN